MIIFGGDRHHMSFNDVILVNLDTILMMDQRLWSNFEECIDLADKFLYNCMKKLILNLKIFWKVIFIIL